jgi:predicted nucleotidyltransferase
MGEQEELLQRLLSAFRADSRVIALWVDGSLGRESGDEVSDIDLGLAVEEEELPEFLSSVPNLLRERCEPVLLQAFGRLFVVVTADWQRVDLFVRTRKEAAAGIPGPVRIVHDPESCVRVTEVEATPLADRFEGLVEEFLRFLGLLPVVAHRGEWIGAFIATGPMTGMVAELMQVENGTDRRIGGALRLSDRLTEEQEQQLREIPALTPDRDSVVAVQAALTQLFLPRARALAAEHGLPYPTRMEEALRQHLRRSGLPIDLGVG